MISGGRWQWARQAGRSVEAVLTGWSLPHRLTRAAGQDAPLPTVPEPTKTSLVRKPTARARTAWPQLAGLDVRCRGQFAYAGGELADGESLKLMRLSRGGSASTCGYALYLPSPTSERSHPRHRLRCQPPKDFRSRLAIGCTGG